MAIGFCGSRADAWSVRDGVIKNECFVDVLNIVPHAIFVLVSLFILIVWSKSLFYQIKATTWVHYKGHSLRWIFTHLLILTIATEIAEGIMSDATDPDTVNLHTYIPHIIALIASFLTIIFYHNVEQWNSPRFLLVLLAYWLSSLPLKVVKAVSLHRNGLTSEHVRIWLTWIDVVVYFILLLIELNVLRVQKYAFFEKPVPVQASPQLGETKYIHEYVNFMSRYTFWWASDILIKGYKNPLELETLGKLPLSENADTQYKILNDSFEKEKADAIKKNRSVKLWRFTLKAYWPMLVLTGILRISADLLAFVGPWCIEHIINYAYRKTHNDKDGRESYQSPSSTATPMIVYQNYSSNQSLIIDTTDTSTQAVQEQQHNISITEFLYNGYTLSVVLLLATLLQNTLLQNHYFLILRESVRYRTALQAMIYDKALKLSGLVVSSGKMTVGQIVNHMSMDTVFLMYMGFFFHYFWSTPITVIVALLLMYFKLGVSALIGGSMVVLAGPIQYFIGKGMSRMQKKVMAQADLRVKKSNETIQGIKVIKLLAWEPLFNESISKARGKEIKYLLVNSIFRILFSLSATIVPALGTMLTFVTYPYIENKPLEASQAISTLSLFNILSLPTALFTLFITSSITAKVSATRLQRYFLAEESESMGIKPDKTNTHSIGIETDDAEEIKMDLLVEYRNGRRKSSATLRKDDELTSSQSSLGSTLSRTPGHSRHNSRASLLDIVDPIRRPSHSPSLVTAALTVNDAKDSGRRRHTSGVSTEDEDEVAERFTLIEPRMLIEVNSGNFSWEMEVDDLALKDINMKIPTGKLTVIVGPVGAGKSSLISAIIGEMRTVSGSVDIQKGTKIAFCAQKAWLQNSSLKDNILFGQNCSYRRYKKVISACALQQDISMLPAGDLTEIGEKGINLSGGQKQRISIARALYSHADTVILDDPFSALDAHVGKHVFEDAILRRLLKHKRTVILVTHQLQYLNYANNIIAMKDGCIQYQGKLTDVKKVDPDLYDSWRKALREAKASESSSCREPDYEAETSSITADGVLTVNQYNRQTSGQSVQSSTFGRQLSQLSNMEEEGSQDDKEGVHEELLKGSQSDTGEKKGELVKKEHRETGAVKGAVYLSYIKACGYLFSMAVMLFMLLYQGLLAIASVMISIWSEAGTDYAKQVAELGGAGNNTTIAAFDNGFYVRTYVTLNMTGILAAFMSGLVLYLTTLRASKRLHNNMLETVLHVPVRFFDTNPAGRILNRFSSDMAQIDQKLPVNIENLLRCSLLTLSALVINSVGTPYFLLAAVPLIVLYYCLQTFFRASARELQRIDSITKSPIYSYFSETLNGLQTIRAYKSNSKFRKVAFSLINNNTNPFLYMQTTNRWLGVRLDYMGSLLVFIAAVASLSACFAGQTSPAFVGLSITYALLISVYLNWIVRMIVETEMSMNSVERVDEYTKLETEPVVHPKGNLTVEKNWPEKGEIEFKNVSLKYDETLQPVVRGASFHIQSGEKVGICGRTGSGKSSLTLSLFRMIHISEGEIIIDGKDTTRVPLPELRSRLAIIPQDPVLFTGTIRFNIDPTGENADDQLWSALETVQLKETIEALPDKLDAPVTEGGENFSVGQKQLFCLARAFLRDNKILVLDEATASIDLETDNKLQRVIATAFKNKTVITIAHRISTILKYDKVMVLSDGEVMEFDNPKTLMDDKDSRFYGLVSSSKK